VTPSAHNTQPWIFALRDGAVDIYLDPSRHLEVSDPTGRQAYISLGCAGGAAIVAIRAKDTVKRADGNFITQTLDRNEIWLAQTPQTFKYSLILNAYEEVAKKGIFVTDDAQAVELCGNKVKLIQGHPNNIKITYLDDINIAESIF